MKIDLKDFHDLITQENPELQIEILEDGNVRIAAPDHLLANKEFLQEIENRIHEVVNMALSIGLFLPSELTEMLNNYVKDDDNESK